MNTQPVILCVDDEWGGLEGRKMLLEEGGYTVLTATNGAEALQLFGKYPVDLVVVDCHMPGMNGEVVAEHIKNRKAHVPVVMLSADEQLPENTLRSVDAFISKSENPDRLLYAVRYLLDMSLLFTPLNERPAA